MQPRSRVQHIMQPWSRASQFLTLSFPSCFFFGFWGKDKKTTPQKQLFLSLANPKTLKRREQLSEKQGSPHKGKNFKAGIPTNQGKEGHDMQETPLSCSPASMWSRVRYIGAGLTSMRHAPQDHACNHGQESCRYRCRSDRHETCTSLSLML